MNKILRFLSAAAAVILASGLNFGAGNAVGETDIADITKKVYPSVVRVEARNSMHKVATGVVIDNDGHILTTALISPHDEKITVITGEGKKLDAKFLGFDSETYLALVQAKDKDLRPLAMGEQTGLNPGSWICVVSISPEMMPAVTQGIISSISEEKMRLNIWVTPGSSGSPVVDAKGRLVGLLRGIYADDKPVLFEFRDKEQVGSGFVFSKGEAPASGMAMAVPLETMKKVAGEIADKGRVQRGWLGVSIAQNDKDRVEIVDVEEDSPAELAKLKEGDVILKVDGQDIKTPAKLASEIRRRAPGGDVVLTVEREGRDVDLKVKLGEYPEETAKRELASRFPRLFPRRATGIPKIREPKQPRIKDFWENRKFIGLYVDELNEELSRFFGLKEGRGLIITKLVEKGPAEKAGLKVGDVIVKAEGRSVESVSDLSEMIQDKKKGDKIKIDVLRDKKPLGLDVEIDEEDSSGFFSWEPLEGSVGVNSADSASARRFLRDWQDRIGRQFGGETKEKSNRIIARLSGGQTEDLENLRIRLKGRAMSI